MTPDMIDAMIEAGLTREQMAALIKHELAKDEEKKAAKRAGNAERQRRFKVKNNASNALPALSNVSGDLTPALKDPLPNLETVEVIPNPPPYSPPALEKSDLGFDEAWKAYPRRQGGNSRKNAEERYRKAVKSGADPASILAGIRAYAAHCDATAKTGTEFVKTAEAWLNGRFWESDWSVSAARSPPARAPIRNSALDGMEELERRFASGNAAPTIRIPG